MGTENKKFNGYWYMSENYVKLKTVAIIVNKDSIPKILKRKWEYKNLEKPPNIKPGSLGFCQIIIKIHFREQSYPFGSLYIIKITNIKKGFIMNTKDLENPLSELISDEIYSILDSRGLINKNL